MDDCTIFSNICDKHSGLRKDAMKGAKKAGKSTYVVHLGACICNHLPRPKKNIHSTFGPC